MKRIIKREDVVPLLGGDYLDEKKRQAYCDSLTEIAYLIFRNPVTGEESLSYYDTYEIADSWRKNLAAVDDRFTYLLDDANIGRAQILG